MNVRTHKMIYMELLIKSFAILFLFGIKRNAVNADDDVILEKEPILPRPYFDDSDRIKFVPRIVGGSVARRGDFHGIVSIQSWKGDHFCGGTLYDDFGNNTHVLTAAHCVMDSKKYRFDPRKLRVMGDDLNNSPKAGQSSRRQIRKVKRIFPHENYDPVLMRNDIAVLVLSSPFNPTDTFGPVPLPNHDLYDNDKCSTAGWGSTSEGGQSSQQLLAVNLSIIPRRLCIGAGAYKPERVGPKAFCAGSFEGGRDSCQGDSGGGLICDGYLTGVVSFGYGCGRASYPGIYTNVFQYKKWIRSQNNSILSNPMISLLALTVTIQLLRLICH